MKPTFNILDIANFSRQRNTTIIREERIKREGSPFYSWQVPVTAASASSVIYVPDQFPDSRKYQPLDWLEICNNDVMDLFLLVNGNSIQIPVPAGAIRYIENRALHHIAVRNDGGGNTTLGKIYVTLRKAPLTTDKWIRGQR